MATPSPTPTSISLPLPVPPLDDAYIDALPLELKLHICSFLTPKDLKPLRLTSKIFAAAAGRYLIDRFILFNCPDSLAALSEIIDHEVFSKCIITIVCDTSLLDAEKAYSSYNKNRELASPPPFWDDYRPEVLMRDDAGSYSLTTQRAMRSTHKQYQIARRNWQERDQKTRARWDFYHSMLLDQEDGAHHIKVAATLQKAFERCPALRNLILSCRHPCTIKKRRLDMLGVEVFDSDDERMSRWSRYLPQSFSILSQLGSLTLINTEIERHMKHSPSLTLANLKHLRISHEHRNGFSQKDLANWTLIIHGAKSLETLILSLPEHDITGIVSKLRSSYLVLCFLQFDFVHGDALVKFLLHHATSLRRLGLASGNTDTDWGSVFFDVAGRMPALQRVQFEVLEAHGNHMTITSAREAECFVVSGGPVPTLQYENSSSIEWYHRAHRKQHTGLPTETERQSGLWQDYEDIANNDWN